MGFDFIESVISEGFNLEETTQDKKYYLDSLNDYLSELYKELGEKEK